MTNALLAYIAVAFTLYAGREWRSASSYRSFVKPLWSDMQEAQLQVLRADLGDVLLAEVGDGRDAVVAGGHAEDHERDEESAEPSMQGVLHGRIVAARSDSK